ncbi:cyclic nucleotide-binding domain-containing protein [Rheinheimera mangrovi]|uniref:cyclic nucleotide-binding domain-containing protein n=1 Tax=Rheinheimera mangrovi TaxID=2498451 RepID=UPI000F8D4797|nr:cyclic nucleotide-binding domain-containing protein [Rheinheimera mangrovi]
MSYTNKLRLMEILARIPLFKDLQPADRELILQMPKAFESYSQGQALIKEGGYEPFFYIILSGQALVYHRQHQIGQLMPSQFVGEVGFICNEPRSATVIAETDMVLMKIDSDSFLRLPDRVQSAIKDKIIFGLTQRVAQLSERLIELDGVLPEPRLPSIDEEIQRSNEDPRA